MVQAKTGDTVRVHYTGKLDDGTVFDTSQQRDPLEFTIGEGQIIPGFERAVVGMSPGDMKTERIPADDAYGPHENEMVLEVERTKMPTTIEPEVGQQLQNHHEDGRVTPVLITGVTDAAVTLDANHPLAGKDLTFEIELVEIEGKPLIIE
jgi:peptidylprolyl isomerase